MNSLDDKLKIGDSVRHRLTKGTFAKEGARWSSAVYTYTGLDGYKADIRSKNGHIKYVPVNDLKIVNTKATDADIAPREVMEVEKILDHRTSKGKYHCLVKWTHLKESSWEPQSNLRLINKNQMSTAEKIYWANIAEASRRMFPNFKNKADRVQKQQGLLAKAQRRSKQTYDKRVQYEEALWASEADKTVTTKATTTTQSSETQAEASVMTQLGPLKKSLEIQTDLNPSRYEGTIPAESTNKSIVSPQRVIDLTQSILRLNDMPQHLHWGFTRQWYVGNPFLSQEKV